MNHVDNYTFINIEEVNTTILNHGVNFEEYYDFDTLLLEEDLAMQYTNWRFDFIVCSRTIYGNFYEYVLEIRNSLWDGNYSFIKLPTGVGTPKVEQNISNPNILRISGDGLTFFTLRLHLSNYADDRVISANSLSIQGLKDVTNIYTKENEQRIRVVEPDGTPVYESTVTLSMNNVERTYKTDVEGYTTIYYPSANPGKYTANITAVKDSKSAKRNVQVERTKSDLDFSIPTVGSFIKGRIVSYKISFKDLPADVVDSLNGAKITVTYRDNSKFISNISDGEATVILNLRKYYDDTVSVEIDVDECDFTHSTKKTATFKLDYYYANSYRDIESECESLMGTDLIRLRKGSNYNYTNDGHDMITIDRDIIIEGEKTGNGWCVLDGKGNGYFDVQKEGHLTLKGIKFHQANPAIYQRAGSTVDVQGCFFEVCENEKHGWMGTAVYCLLNNDCKTNRNLFITNIENTYFYNNYGSCIYHGGQLKIRNCYFLKDNMKYLYQAEPHVVEQAYGDCTMTNSKIVLDTGDAISPTNMSWAKIVAVIGTTATLNNKKGSSMQGDNSTNLFVSPYSNESYLYCKYYYPHSGINANIVASPLKGYERKAGSHAVAGTNWAYKDNIQLTRVSWGTDNKTNKWTIKLPDNGGYYVL